MLHAMPFAPHDHDPRNAHLPARLPACLISPASSQKRKETPCSSTVPKDHALPTILQRTETLVQKTEKSILSQLCRLRQNQAVSSRTPFSKKEKAQEKFSC